MPHDPEPTPEPTPEPDPDLSPAEEEVRRLLADARHTEPMPADVAARLDGVLADLAAEDGAGRPRVSDHSVVRATDLAAARRRRTARNFLVAAAAVVAVGVGINQAGLSVSGSGDDADGGSESMADSAGGGDRAAEPSAASGSESTQDDKEAKADRPGAGDLGSFVAGGPPVRLSEARFGAQVRRLRADPRAIALQDRSGDATDGLIGLGRTLQPGCSTRGWGAGLVVPVRYDGALGALVFRAPRGETQVVDLFLCGNDEPSRSITLPRR